MFNERRAANRNQNVPQPSPLSLPKGPSAASSYDGRQRDSKLNHNQPPRYPQAYAQSRPRSQGQGQGQGHGYIQQQQHNLQQYDRRPLPSQPRGYGNQNYHGQQGYQYQHQHHQGSYGQRRPHDNGSYGNDGPRAKRHHSDRGRQHNSHQQQQHQQSYQRRYDVKVQPLASFKPKDSKWDITHPRLVGFSAKFVKTNGVFPTPGSVLVDTLSDEVINELKEKQRKLEEQRINSMGSQKLPSPLASKVSRTVIFKGYDVEKHTLQVFHKYLENFLASTVIPNVSYEELEITSRTEADKVIVECVKSVVATTLMSFNMKRIDKFDCVVLVKRPFEYIQLVKNLADAKEGTEGNPDDVEDDEDDDEEEDGEDEDDGEEVGEDVSVDKGDGNESEEKVEATDVNTNVQNEADLKSNKDDRNDTGEVSTNDVANKEETDTNAGNEEPKPDDKEDETTKVVEDEVSQPEVDDTKSNAIADKTSESVETRSEKESNETETADSNVRILDEIVETASLVCVNNLDIELSNHEITEKLSKYGTVHSLAVLIDKITYDSNGIAFFQFTKLKDPLKKLKDVLAEISATEKWKCFLVCENPKNDYYQNIELTVNNVKDYVDTRSQDISRRCMSNTVQLLNLVSLTELTDATKLDMVETELKTELGKLNGFEKMCLVRPGTNFKGQIDEVDPEFGRVYAKFSSSKHARACLNKICGKYFRGRLVIGSYIDDSDFSSYFL
ncbi:hypothetical protein CANINC_000715 [Pichia inconspicua]|uniref:RRM domain-containing protein n=1 Tax=Pichia inconspicua TaxID=52247 RepID=A0A4T0X5S4_9ASCO|nr:hypothetical protein CANINC_000715 [[Candida] inconspicua]